MEQKTGKYRGRNFDPNHDPQEYKKQKEAERKDDKPKPKQQPKLKATEYKVAGPRATHAANNPTPQRNEPLFKSAIFSPEVQIRQDNMRHTFHPSSIRITDLTDLVWQQYPQIDKQMLTEGFRYYVATLYWLRVIRLKQATNVLLTDTEVKVNSIFGSTALNVPEPVYLYLRALGTIEDVGTAQTLLPQFPNLPEQDINGFGGYFGAIDTSTHNLYEEYTTLGTTAEGIRNSLSDQQPGYYPSSLAIKDVPANENLQGYRALGYRQSEAKNFFLSLGISSNTFPEDIPKTGINYGLVTAISTWVGLQISFKNFPVVMATSETVGSFSQIIIEHPVKNKLTSTIPCRRSEIISHSLEKVSATIFGVAKFGLFELYKEAAPGSAPISVRSQTWSCLSFSGATAATTLPNDWVNNRNALRSLPDEFKMPRFDTRAVNSYNACIRIVGRLVAAKR